MSKKRKPDEMPEEITAPELEETLDVTEAVTALEAALQAEKDRNLRLAAEYDNYRKRSQKEREALFIDLKSGVVAEFLPVYDNLERALQQETADEAFYKGVEMTMTQLREVFQKLGVQEIPAVGEKFNPALHNAVYHVEDKAYGESEIVEQFLTGFLLGDKVIRHSMVKVAN